LAEPDSTGVAMGAAEAGASAEVPGEPPAHVLFASLVGTTIEFFDSYIYAHGRTGRWAERCPSFFPQPCGTPGARSRSIAGIFGASLAPYIATWPARSYGLRYVGYYLTAAAPLTLIGLLAARETKDDRL
jgi:hypothetical protein